MPCIKFNITHLFLKETVSHIVTTLCNWCVQLIKMLLFSLFVAAPPFSMNNTKSSTSRDSVNESWILCRELSLSVLHSSQHIYLLLNVIEIKGKAWWKGYSSERAALWYLAPPAVILFEPRERDRGGGTVRFICQQAKWHCVPLRVVYVLYANTFKYLEKLCWATYNDIVL